MKKIIRKSMERQQKTAYQELHDEAKPKKEWGVGNYTSRQSVPWDAMSRSIKRK